MIVPAINPLRIRQVGGGASDLVLDTRTQREVYSRGINPIDFYPDFTRTFVLQVEQEAGDSFSEVSLYDDDNVFNRTLTPVDITPVGWVGNTIYTISISAPAAGYYYIKIIESGVTYLSDIFKHTSNTQKDKVFIRYYDANNSGGVFYNSTSLIWNPEATYTGQVNEAPTDNELTINESYNGNEIVTRAVVKFTAELILTDIGTTYYNAVGMQLTRSNVFINGIEYTVTNIEAPRTEESDVFDLKAKLTLKNNDYNMKYS